MRGRWISVAIMLCAIAILAWFTWYLVTFEVHRPVGFLVSYLAEAAALLFVWVLCMKLVIKIDRQDLDSQFVL